MKRDLLPIRLILHPLSVIFSWRRFLGRGGFLLVVDVALLIFLVLQVLFFWGRSQEDAYISYRYAWNFVNGHGLVYNAGEHVEGISNLLWTLSLAGLYLLGLPFPAAALCMSLAYCVLTFALLRWVCRHTFQERRCLSRIPLLFFVCMTAVPASCGNGLEGSGWGFALCLALAGATLYRGMLLTVSGVLLLLHRPEGIVLAGAVGCWYLYTCVRGKMAWRGFAVFAGLTAATAVLLFVFRLAYYGDWVPNSIRAKAMPCSLALLGDGAEYLRSYFAYAGWPALILALCAVVHPRRRDLFALLGVLLCFNFFLVVRNGGDWMTDFRLLTPYVPLLGFLVALGIEAIAMRRRIIGQVLVLAGLALAFRTVEVDLFPKNPVLAIAHCLWMLPQDPAKLSYCFIANTEPVTVKDVVTPDDKVVLEAGGVLGYLLNGINVIEVNGLTDREIATRKNPYAYQIPAIGTINWVETFKKDPAYLILFWPLHLNNIASIPGTSENLDHFLLVQAGPPDPLDMPKGEVLLIRDDQPALSRFLLDYGSFAPARDYVDLENSKAFRWVTPWDSIPWRRWDGASFPCAWRKWGKQDRLSCSLEIPMGKSRFAKPLPGAAPLVLFFGVDADAAPRAKMTLSLQRVGGNNVTLGELDIGPADPNCFRMWSLTTSNAQGDPSSYLCVNFDAATQGRVLVAAYRWCKAPLPVLPGVYTSTLR